MNSVRKGIPYILIGLYIFFISFGIFFASLRIKSLDHQGGSSIDFTLYMQSYASLIHNRDTPAISPPNGTALFLKGSDGAHSITHLIHFEPIKYVGVLLFSLTKSPLIIYSFSILLFYSPLLYGAHIVRSNKKYSWLLLLVALVYVLFPASFIQAVSDTRPFTLLYAAYLLFAFSIFFNRSFIEKIVALNFLLVIREEALLMAVPFILYELAKEVRAKNGFKTSITLAASWTGWLVLTILYFIQIAPYYNYGTMKPSGTIGAIANSALPILICTIVFAALICLYSIKKVWRIVRSFAQKYPDVSVVTLFGLTALPPVVLAFIAASPALWPPFFVFNRFSFMIVVTVIALSIAMAIHIPISWKKSYTYLFLVFVAISVAVQAVGSKSLITRIEKMMNEVDESELVFSSKRQINDSDFVFVDSRTLQAFFDREQSTIKALHPLPSYEVPNPEYYFPNNTSEVVDIIMNNRAQAIIEKSSLPMIEEIASEANMTISLVKENSIYSWVTFVAK